MSLATIQLRVLVQSYKYALDGRNCHRHWVTLLEEDADHSILKKLYYFACFENENENWKKRFWFFIFGKQTQSILEKFVVKSPIEQKCFSWLFYGRFIKENYIFSKERRREVRVKRNVSEIVWKELNQNVGKFKRLVHFIPSWLKCNSGGNGFKSTSLKWQKLSVGLKWNRFLKFSFFWFYLTQIGKSLWAPNYQITLSENQCR